MGVSLSKKPPGQRPPGQRPLDRDPLDRDPLDRDPLDREARGEKPPRLREQNHRQDEKYLPCRNFVAGGKNTEE